MGRGGEDPARPSLAAFRGGAAKGGSRADQIIVKDHRPAAYIADEEIASNDTAGALLVDKPGGRLASMHARKRPAKPLGALRTADIGRNHGKFFAAKPRREMLDENRHRFDIFRWNTKGVLVGGAVVYVERYERIGAARLEHPGNVLGRDRIERLAALILACVAEIRSHSRHPCRARVL